MLLRRRPQPTATLQPAEVLRSNPACSHSTGSGLDVLDFVNVSNPAAKAIGQLLAAAAPAVKAAAAAAATAAAAGAAAGGGAPGPAALGGAQRNALIGKLSGPAMTCDEPGEHAMKMQLSMSPEAAHALSCSSDGTLLTPYSPSSRRDERWRLDDGQVRRGRRRQPVRR